MSEWLYYHPFEKNYEFYDLQHEEPAYNTWAEWYLTLCLAALVIESVFATTISEFADQQSYVIKQLTGYAILPTEAYFLTIGMLVGLFIFMVGRSNSRYVPIMGAWSFVAYWGVYLLGTVRGLRNPFWHLDARALLLTTIVIPWAAVLSQRVRLDVVMRRLIWLAIPLAVINIARGYRFITLGPRITAQMNEQTHDLGMDLRSDMALLGMYSLALARTFTRSGKGVWMTLILALGVVGPLSKPSVFAFAVVTIAALLIGTYAGARSRLVSVGRANIAAIIVGVVLLGGIALWLNQREGAGFDFLMDRFFKFNVDISKRDLSTGRFKAWAYAMEVWRTNPLLGVGLGTRVPTLGRAVPFIVYHNQWIKILAEMGIVGVVVVTGAFLLWMRRALRGLSLEVSQDRFWPRLGLTCFVITIGIVCLGDEPLGSYTLSYIFWIALALEAGAHSMVLRGAVATWPEEQDDGEAPAIPTVG